MKLNYTYKIYWFENEDGWLKSAIEKIEENYDGSKIQFEFIKFKNGEGVADIFAETEIDIVLMDYNLSGIKGDEIIQTLRGKNILCDIIFYSNDPNFDNDLEEKEGVHTTARNNLISELNKKINKHKILIEDVSTLRGNFITSAIDLEVKMNDIVCAYFNLDPEKEIFLKENFLEKEFFSFQKKYATTNRISKIISEKCAAIYKESGEDDKKEISKKLMIKATQVVSVIKVFEKQIIDIRNTLAHSKDKIGENGETIFTHITSGKEEVIDEKWIREKMNNLVMHSINLDRLLSFI